MVSDQVRNEVWLRLLDIARLVRYYAVLSDRYRRNYTIIRFLLYAAAASGIAAFLDVLPPIAQLISGGVIALIITWDFVSDYGKKAAVLHAISLQCGELENEWQELWIDVDNGTMTNEEVIDKNRQLIQRMTGVTGGVDYASIPEDQKLNEECAAQAYQVAEGRYAVV